MLQRIAKLIENSKEWWKGDKEGFFWTGGVFLVILLAGGIFRLLVLWQDWSPIALTHEGEQTGFVSKEKLIQEYMTASGLPGLVAASRKGKRRGTPLPPDAKGYNFYSAMAFFIVVVSTSNFFVAVLVSNICSRKGEGREVMIAFNCLSSGFKSAFQISSRL